MKPSEIIAKEYPIGMAQEIMRDKIIDQMAEDIKAIKNVIIKIDCKWLDENIVRIGFPYREWEE